MMTYPESVPAIWVVNSHVQQNWNASFHTVGKIFYHHFQVLPSLKLTFSHLKMDGW